MPDRGASTRGEARRRQILDAALEVIREQPIGDVQLAAIAAHAGMRPNHVLYYFGSRDDVLIAAVAHAEQQLAEGRSARLRAIGDAEQRLIAYVRAYLPTDRHDPVWKLWIEGWLRSASREEFGAVGWDAYLGWRGDLVEAIEHARGAAGAAAEEIAQRLIFLLDGIAVHVLAGHVEPGEAAEIAMRSMRSELRLPPTARAR